MKPRNNEPDTIKLFGKLNTETIKKCSANRSYAKALLIAYVDQRSGMDWMFNLYNICNETGIKYKTVKKYVAELVNEGVLIPASPNAYTNTMRTNMSYFELNMARYLELYWTKKMLNNLGNENRNLGSQFRDLGNKCPDNLVTNADVDIRRKEIKIEDTSKEKTDALNTQTPAKGSESVSSHISCHPFFAPVLPRTSPTIIRLTGKDLENHLDHVKKCEARARKDERTKKAWERYQALKEQYASPLADNEFNRSMSPSEKAEVLKAGIRSLRNRGCYDEERGYGYDARVVGDDKGLELARRFFELNPSVAVFEILNQMEIACIDDHQNPEPQDGEFDKMLWHRRGMNLAFLIKHLQRIHTECDLDWVDQKTRFLEDVAKN